MPRVISDQAIKRRKYWVQEIQKISGIFTDDFQRLETEISAELKRDGVTALLDHLRLAGDIPEAYGHDSSQEKLYSKYTDFLLAQAFVALGLKSVVIEERGDAADVESVALEYDFVADAKAFRLSRTAKNQKDFKVQAMDGWKRGKKFAIVVCPIYQLPTKSSQIYQQASARNVCVFTYSHLAVLVSYALTEGCKKAEKLLHDILKTVQALNPSKDASAYWLAINRTMLGFSSIIPDLWKTEKQAAVESIAAAKEEALEFLSSERTKILRMDHAQAIAELIKVHRIENRIAVIKSMTDNGIMEIK